MASAITYRIFNYSEEAKEVEIIYYFLIGVGFGFVLGDFLAGDEDEQ